jgi:hypothetical protein
MNVCEVEEKQENKQFRALSPTPQKAKADSTSSRKPPTKHVAEDKQLKRSVVFRQRTTQKI